MTCTPPPTIFIAHDDLVLLTAIEKLVCEAQWEPCCCHSAAKLLDRYEPTYYGCVVLGAALPDMAGLELQGRLLAAGCRSPLIFISEKADVSTVVAAMRAGAVDFLEQPDLLERLPESLHKAVEMDRQRRLVDAQHQQTEARQALLTLQERHLADCMAAGLSTKEAAARLEISLRTVHLRQASILEKLQLESTADLLLWMLRDVARKLGDAGTDRENGRNPLP